jgi:hypothetical protein
VIDDADDIEANAESSQTKVHPAQAAGAYLLVDRTVNQGRRKLKLFGADLNAWTVRTFESAGTGRRFEKIVVVLPDQMSVDLMNRVQHLQTLLAINGTLEFI